MRQKISICAGEKFHRLTVTGEAKAVKGHRMVRCVCKCGKEVTVRFDSARRGDSKSCGCLRADVMRSGNNSRKHGHFNGGTTSPEMGAYRRMLTRCLNPASVKFRWYGREGIEVSPRWRGKHGFEHFLADVGPKPSSAHTLGRILDGPIYGPGRVAWQTPAEQIEYRRQAKTLLLLLKLTRTCQAQCLNLKLTKKQTRRLRLDAVTLALRVLDSVNAKLKGKS